MAKIRKLVETGKTEQGVPVHVRCTGTCLTCTGTCWPKTTKTQDVPVHVQGVLVHVTKNVQNVYFSPLFPYF